MRSTASILAAVLALTAEASVRFTEPVWRPDLGIAAPALANSHDEPLELPKAKTFLLTGDRGDRCLEDRFDTFDLWVSQTMRGRWRDEDGNILYVARLATRPPNDEPGTVRTRTDFLARQAKFPFDPDTPPMLFVTGDSATCPALASVMCWEHLRRIGVRSDLHVLELPAQGFPYRAAPGTSGFTWLDRIWEFMNHRAISRDPPKRPTVSSDGVP